MATTKQLMTKPIFVLGTKHIGATTCMSILPHWGAIEKNTFCMAAILKSEMASTKIMFNYPYFPHHHNCSYSTCYRVRILLCLKGIIQSRY